VLSDALHLTTDPYTTHAGAKPSAASGAAPSAPSAGDAHVSTNAVNLAIASRQAYQFRGGSGAGGGAGGGASKEWLQELAKERNKHQLPRVMAHEWGVRLPNERFVLSGVGFGLKDTWVGDEGDEEEGGGEDDDEQMEDAMGPAAESTETKKDDAAPEEGLGDMLGDDLEEDDDEMME
jgi:transcription initiation factor TFIID subunit 9B